MNLERTLASKDRMYEEKDASTLPVGHDPTGHHNSLPGKTALSGSKPRPSSESSCKSCGKCKRAKRQWADSEQVLEDADLNKSRRNLQIQDINSCLLQGGKPKVASKQKVGSSVQLLGGTSGCIFASYLHGVRHLQTAHIRHINLVFDL